MKYKVIETNEGNIVLQEIGEIELSIDDKVYLRYSGLEFPMIFETLDVHKEIWKKNYLEKEVQEQENFQLLETHLEGEIYQLIALPVITSNPD